MPDILLTGLSCLPGDRLPQQGMEDGELSDDSGSKHPAEDLIIQKALRRAAAAEASTSDLLSPLAPHEGLVNCLIFTPAAHPPSAGPTHEHCSLTARGMPQARHLISSCQTGIHLHVLGSPGQACQPARAAAVCGCHAGAASSGWYAARQP